MTPEDQIFWYGHCPVCNDEPWPHPDYGFHHYRQPNTMIEQVRREVQDDLDRDIFAAIDFYDTNKQQTLHGE